MKEEVVHILYDAGRGRRVEIFRRENGSFGFSVWRYAADERVWIPWGRYSECFIDSAAAAEREARERVEWLSGSGS